MPARKPPSPVELEDWWEKDRSAVYAIQALERGAASAEQQQRALNFIVGKLCGYPGVAFDLHSDRISAFLAGKQTVGRHIAMLIYLNLEAVKEKLQQNG